MGDYAKTVPLLQRSLKITEIARCPDHPQTAGSLNNLGDLYRTPAVAPPVATSAVALAAL
jgi:hypothetical protein